MAADSSLQRNKGVLILPPMLTLGWSNMRDAATALVANGRIVAAAEEEGFVRVQTVDTDSNSRHRLLQEAFQRKPGVPILLNTSFNVNEPIVCAPGEAVRCFLRAKVGWLVMGNLLERRLGTVDERTAGAGHY